MLACHGPVLDGFYHLFQATVHFPLSSAVGEPQQSRQISGTLGIEPRTAGSRRKYAHHCAMLPPQEKVLSFYINWFMAELTP